MILIEKISKEGKNVHMDHIDELPILYGYEGVEYGLALMTSVYENLLSGNLKSISQKWDGCVAPETLLKTDLGLKPIIEIIKDFQKGIIHKVKGWSFEDNKSVMVFPKNVNAEFKTKQWVKIVLENGGEFFCTADHLIFTENRGYVKAEELNSSDILKEDIENIFIDKILPFFQPILEKEIKVLIDKGLSPCE